jgi:hypothetical protein
MNSAKFINLNRHNPKKLEPVLKIGRPHYLVCCNASCPESGIIKKNINKCPLCWGKPCCLSLEILNMYFCRDASECDESQCCLVHAMGPHASPSHISPCLMGRHCPLANCPCLHPDVHCGAWLVR